MRRALVLTQESARNPFRASLPPHVFVVEDNVELSEKEQAPAKNVPFWRLTASDVRGFATTYFATLAAALAFLA